MRRRLVTIYMSLLVLSLIALTVPFGMDVAARATQTAFMEQQGDALRFASMAEPVLESGNPGPLAAEFERFAELFGVRTALINRDGQVVAGVVPTETLDGLRRSVDRGLRGVRPVPETVWPWQSKDLAVIEPINQGEPVAVIVTVRSTADLRAGVARSWGLIALGCLTACALTWFAARRLAGWTLEPVRELDSATHEITEGHLEARVPPGIGPPELRRLAASFNVMADTVSDMLSRQRAFVSQASHQLRTPLGVLRLRVENLGDHVVAEGKEEHELTLEETVRLGRILEGLLALSRTETKGTEAAAVDADEIVAGRIEAWRPQAAGHGVALHDEGAVGRPVLAIPEAIDQVLDALIDNAVKFGAEMVVVRSGIVDDHAEIHVVDDGPGLPQEDRARAAERFWRSQEHQNIDGSGLGLSIATVLVEASGGTFEILGRDDGPGLDVRIRLPLAGQDRVSR